MEEGEIQILYNRTDKFLASLTEPNNIVSDEIY